LLQPVKLIILESDSELSDIIDLQTAGASSCIPEVLTIYPNSLATWEETNSGLVSNSANGHRTDIGVFQVYRRFLSWHRRFLESIQGK
jgi:hypothetical protein